MNISNSKYYTQGFYKNKRDATYKAVLAIVQYIIELTHPRSVVDGVFLSIFHD
ncbi:MAG: hypothetical protein KJ736_00890 [Candidatus Omnitrophica bacterium]|nr:hypothetical protein [Candidatus Omnitrophota bacterium]